MKVTVTKIEIDVSKGMSGKPGYKKTKSTHYIISIFLSNGLRAIVVADSKKEASKYELIYKVGTELNIDFKISVDNFKIDGLDRLYIDKENEKIFNSFIKNIISKLEK